MEKRRKKLLNPERVQHLLSFKCSTVTLITLPIFIKKVYATNIKAPFFTFEFLLLIKSPSTSQPSSPHSIRIARLL